MRADDDAALVLDIVTAAREALTFVQGLDLERFRDDAKAHSAVLYQILIVGEAAGGRCSHGPPAPGISWTLRSGRC